MKRWAIYTIIAIFLCPSIHATQLVGKISANLGVGETGAATYTIPIDIQKSANGFSPDIALTYNSQAGNGLVGLGWGISGLSSITISPRSVYFDNTAEELHEGDDNVYYLDGMRLLLVSGVNGRVGATYRTEAEQYSTITIDSVLINTPAIFTVRTNDGCIYKYGSHTGRMHYNTNACYEWALDYAEDRLGNYINYEYAQDGLMLYPTFIRYGKNKHGSANIPYTVEFVYASRPDTISVHRFESIQPFTKRLRYIRCRASEASSLYMSYTLTYNENVYSCLASVRQQGSSDSYPATVFTWQDIPEYSLVQSAPSVNTGAINVSRSHFFAADINNDGLTEMMALYADTIAGSPFRRAAVWERDNSGGNFTISDTYSVQAGFNIADMFLSLRCGGSVAHVNSAPENSILLPCFEIDINNTRCMMFYAMKEGLQLPYLMRSAADGACHVITDMDKDGMDDIIIVEQAKLSGTYPASVIHFNMLQEYMTCNNFSMNLAAKPTRITSADFNGDGMADLLICTENGFYIYWNHAGQFSDSNRYYSSTFSNCDVLEIGDVNADGLPDLIINPHHSTTWKCAVNQGNTTSPFAYHTISKLESMLACNNDNGCEAYCMLQDMDGDGKSDLVAGVAIFNSSKQFIRGNMVILKSEGAQFTLLDSMSFSNKNTFPAYKRIVQGDFDGDGVSEIMYYGGTPNSSSTDVAWHTLKVGGYSPATNRIKSITDGLGTVQNIKYGLLTNDSIYEANTNSTFPLLTLRAAIPVTQRIETISGNDTVWSEFAYKDAIFHWQGKGLLGFKERNTTESSGTYSVARNSLNQDYYVLYRTREELYASDESLWKTDTLYTFFEAVGSKSYFMHTDLQGANDVVNHFVNVKSTGYNSFGIPNYKYTRDELFESTTDYTFWQSPNCPARNLPSLVETTKSGGTDGADETIRIEYTRDAVSGQPLTRRTYHNNTLTETDLYTYNTCGQVLTHTTIHGNSTDSLTTSYTYNTQGLIVQETNPLGQVTTYEYNTRGVLTKETNHLNVETTYGYDAMGRRKSVTSPTDHVNIYYYSGNYGNAAYRINENKRGQPASSTYYDGFGRKIAEAVKRFDGRWLYTDYTYLKNGQVGFVSYPHTSSTVSTDGTYNTYDVYGRLTSQTDTQGKTSTWTYGPFRVTSVIDGVSRTDRYSHRDYITSVEDNSGYVDYEIDASGRVIEAYHNGISTTLDYDDFGNLVQTTDMQGTTRNYTYDNNGHPQYVTQGTSSRYTQYDKYGRLLSKTFHDAGFADKQTFYTYNSLGQLVCDSSSNHVYTYAYDSYGRLHQENRTVKADSTESMSCTYKYYNDRLSKKTTTFGSSSVTLTEKYTYDNGWLTKVTINDSVVWKLDGEDNKGYTSRTSNRIDSTAWDYDIYGHLISQHVSGRHNLSQNYVYDQTTGNVTSWNSDACTYDNLNRLTGWKDITYSYDNEGNILSMSPLAQMTYSGFKLSSFTATPDMSIPGLGNYTLKYLRSIERPGTIQDAYNQIEYAYDGDGCRTWMKKKYIQIPPINQPGDTVITTLGTRYYLSENCEIDQANNQYKRYFYYVGGTPYDAPAVVLVSNDTLSIYQIYRDNLGSIVMYASENDSTKHFKYTPWGLRIENDPLATYYSIDYDPTPFIRFFTGHEEIPYFNLLNTNARLYDPIAGRFYSPDPVLATEGGPLDFNPYVYARNNPLSYVDQDGELAWFVPLIAAAVGGAFNVASNWDNIHNIGQGFAFFGMGAAASALSSLGAVAAGFTFAGAATIGAGNSILSQGFNNGWNHINWAQVGLSTGMSILTSYIGGWIGDKLSAPLSNITSGISNSIVREALTGALVNSVTGFSLGTTTSLLMGNNFKTALRDGGTAAGNGFVSGAALGLAKGYIQSRLEKKPMQMHHFATNKNKRYTPQMKAITDKYGLDLNGDWNKELMPHLGRHPNYYHEYVLEQMTQISIIAGKNQNLFLDLYEQNVKMPIRNNPNMLYKNYWLNH